MTTTSISPLKAGDAAPDFNVQLENGKQVSLASFRGKKLVLFFYPRDNTPTCTIEACNLRDHYRKLEKAGYVVIGVSPDTARKHQNFIDKFKLPYHLIVDGDLNMIKDYGIWGWKKFMGREYDGLHRTTFVIDEKGVIIEKIFPVKSKEHAEQILATEHA